MTTSYPRRLFFKKCFTSAMTVTGAIFVVAGCHSGDKKGTEKNPPTTADACSNAELGAEEIKKREALGFVDKSPEKNKHCSNCKLYLPPPPGVECSKCQLFKGTVPAAGYCTYWAPQG